MPLDVVVGVLQQLQDDVLDVFTDIAGFRQRRGIRHRERHVEDSRQRLRQQRLAAARGADEQDVRLRQFHVVVLRGVVQALVVVVDGDRQHAFGVELADHIGIENRADLLRRGNAITRLDQRVLVLFTNDVHAQLDAFVANEHGRPGNQLSDLVLALAAEGAVKRVLFLSHLSSLTRPGTVLGVTAARCPGPT
jgi:hypothetical protein